MLVNLVQAGITQPRPKCQGKTIKICLRGQDQASRLTSLHTSTFSTVLCILCENGGKIVTPAWCCNCIALCTTTALETCFLCESVLTLGCHCCVVITRQNDATCGVCEPRDLLFSCQFLLTVATFQMFLINAVVSFRGATTFSKLGVQFLGLGYGARCRTKYGCYIQFRALQSVA